MSWSSRAALAACFAIGTSAVCLAQTSSPPAASPTFDELVGKKLTAIDGSSIALSPAEGGLAREIVSPTGSIQRIYFAYLSDKLGTVADASDIRKITGVFRRVSSGIEIQYGDGSTEKLVLNPGGGLTLQTIAASAAACMAWYPEGHVFSVEERKAALAAFAVKLGLADNSNSAAKSDCGGNPAQAAGLKPASAPAPDTKLAGDTGKAVSDAAKPPQSTRPASGAPVAPPIPARAPRVVTASGKAPAAVGPTTAAIAAETQAIEVRKSDVHVIDKDPAPQDAKPQVLASATPPGPTTTAVLAPANSTGPAAAAVVASAPPPGPAAAAVVASATPSSPAAPEQRGASTCLSVESNGMHWGFRNRCGYDVQFAYCLMSGNPLASCHDGAVAGSVAANGFGALVADESLKETDAKHDFRWVACQGGAGEVIPHLDEIEPPSGRCVR